MNCCSIVEAPWTRAFVQDVLDERARDAADVDAAVALKRLSSIEITASLTIARDLRRG